VTDNPYHLSRPQLVRRLLDAFARYQDQRIREGHLKKLIDANIKQQRSLREKNRHITRQKEELAGLNELKNRFLGMAAHDLRNPLTIMQMYSDYLLEDGDGLTEEQRDYLGIIHESSTFMRSLIDDLLDISHIESGEVTLEYKRADYIAFIHHLVERNRPIAARKEIMLDVETSSPAVSFSFDQKKIEQVMTNLLSNAIKYSSPGHPVRVRIFANQTVCVTEVIDSGPGIPEKDLENLFQPFHRSSVKTTGGEKSTGLGLTIVKRIVEGHGGSVSVSSRVGRGTAFRYELPLTPSPS